MNRIPDSPADEAATDNGVGPIRDALEQMILDGRLTPGERLNELAVARTLDVSRGQLREAVRLLEEAGLVSVVHYHGVFVRRLSLEEVLDLYDVRAGLARVVGKLLASRITKDELDELTDLFERMEAARGGLDAQGYEDLHARFHARILEFTRNPTLIALHRQVDRQLRLFMRRSVVSLARLRSSNNGHRHILDHAAKGDGERTARALEADVMHGRARLLDSLERT